MSFDVEKYLGWGSGKHGDWSGIDPPATGRNYTSFVAVIDSDPNYGVTDNRVIRLETDNVGWEAGDQLILSNLLCFASKPSQEVANKLGQFEVRQIVQKISSWELVLDAVPTAIDSGDFYICATKIMQFKDVTINEGQIYQLATSFGFHDYAGCQGMPCGGILALKVSGTLTLNGGKIAVPAGCTANHYYRPLMQQEKELLDYNTYTDYFSDMSDTITGAGNENYLTKDHLTIQGGAGAIFIMAKKIVFANSNSRIGFTNDTEDIYGMAYCRAAVNSPFNNNTKFTSWGGASILIAAGEIQGWFNECIAKYRLKTAEEYNRNQVHWQYKGFGRCYIATTWNAGEWKLPPFDEALYALDTIHDDSPLKTLCNIQSFGEGKTRGTYSSSTTTPINSYGRVNLISDDYKSFTCNQQITGSTLFDVGTLVMIHAIEKKLSSRRASLPEGRFTLARVTAINGNRITVDTAFEADLSWQYVQLIAIPEHSYASFTGTYQATPKWTNGYGGIFAIACSETLTLNNAIISVEGKGTDEIYNEDYKNKMGCRHYLGNAAMQCRLPIGSGHGSIFILAKNIAMNSSTRLGATYDGSAFNGRGYWPGKVLGGGYSGGHSTLTGALGYGGNGGAGGNGGTDGFRLIGGNHGNGQTVKGKVNVTTTADGGRQGAHIFIVANKITGFNLSAISTGGEGGTYYNRGFATDAGVDGGHGGAGYGGAGAGADSGYYSVTSGAGGWRCGGGGAYYQDSAGLEYWGTGGGAAGGAFIYCNEVDKQNTAGLYTS